MTLVGFRPASSPGRHCLVLVIRRALAWALRGSIFVGGRCCGWVPRFLIAVMVWVLAPSWSGRAETA